MQKIICSLFLIIISFNSFSQTVDKLRLVYDEKEIVSKQVGVTVSNDGKLGAFAYENKVIKVVNLMTGKTLISFNNIHSEIFEIRFNFSGTKIISAGDETSVAVFDVASGTLDHSFQVKKSIIKLAIGKINNNIAVYQDKFNLVVYNMDAKKELLSFEANNKFSITALDFHPTLNKIAIANIVAPLGSLSKIKCIKIYDLETSQLSSSFGKTGNYLTIAYNSTGDRLYLSGDQTSAMGYKHTTLQYYDFKTAEFVELISTIIPVNTIPIALPSTMHLSDNYFLSIKEGNSFDVVDLNTKKMIYTTKGDKINSRKLTSLLRDGIAKIFPLSDKKSYFINAADDNISWIYNTEKNSITAYVYSDSNDDFVVVGRDGRLDGSQKAISKLYWSERKSDKRIPIENTFDQFYTPKLLAQLLTGVKLEEIKVDINNLKPVPDIKMLNPATDEVEFRSTTNVSLITSEKVLKLEFAATDKGGGLNEIRVYQNGKLINTSTETVNTLDQSVKKVVEMELIPGDNTIKIIATNADKIENSKTTIVKYNGVNNDPSKLFVLAIGINKYEKSTYDLNFAVPDATGFIEAIKIASVDLFADVNITLVQDAQASKKNILAAIDKIKPLIKQGDVFVFYYAGHGAMTIPANGEASVFHLVPNNITNFYSTEMLKERGISTSELQKISKDINAQKQLFVIDACQSGGAVDALASRGALNEKELANLARSTGTYFLTASGSDQLAGEFAALGHGVFTYAILQAFTGKADAVNSDSKVSVKELSLFVENAVPDLSEKYKGQRQFPVSYGYGQDFPLVLANKYKMKDVADSKIGKFSSFTLEELVKMKQDAVQKEDYKLADEIKAEIEKRK